MNVAGGDELAAHHASSWTVPNWSCVSGRDDLAGGDHALRGEAVRIAVRLAHRDLDDLLAGVVVVDVLSAVADVVEPVDDRVHPTGRVLREAVRVPQALRDDLAGEPRERRARRERRELEATDAASARRRTRGSSDRSRWRTSRSARRGSRRRRARCASRGRSPAGP